MVIRTFLGTINYDIIAWFIEHISKSCWQPRCWYCKKKIRHNTTHTTEPHFLSCNFIAEQDELPCGPALWPMGPVVRQWAPNQPVCPKWVAGPHIWCLWSCLEPAGLQVSSTRCKGLPFTTASFSSFYCRTIRDTRAARAMSGHRRESWLSLPQHASSPLQPLILFQTPFCLLTDIVPLNVSKI